MSATEARRVMARSGRTFHLASRLLPGPMRIHAAELYAFCRRVDDLADDTAAGQRDPLTRTIAALERNPLGPESAEAGWPVELEEHLPGISKVAVTLTRALAADTGPQRIGTEQELLAYAFGVAGTVGLMMCRVLGAPPAGATAASHLGIAMQLTNIARDVREDFERDRIYLPASWIEPADLKAALTGGPTSPLIAATARLLALADSYYASAHMGMHYLPLRARTAILAAASCYREIGVRVSRAPEASWRARTVVSRGRKAILVGRSTIVAPALGWPFRSESRNAERLA